MSQPLLDRVVNLTVPPQIFGLKILDWFKAGRLSFLALYMLSEKDYRHSDNTSGRKEEMENPGKGQLKALLPSAGAAGTREQCS